MLHVINMGVVIECHILVCCDNRFKSLENINLSECNLVIMRDTIIYFVCSNLISVVSTILACNGQDLYF